MESQPEKEKQKNISYPFVREQIKGGERGCMRAVVVFIGLVFLFGIILFVMSQL